MVGTKVIAILGTKKVTFLATKGDGFGTKVIVDNSERLAPGRDADPAFDRRRAVSKRQPLVVHLDPCGAVLG